MSFCPYPARSASRRHCQDPACRSDRKDCPVRVRFETRGACRPATSSLHPRGVLRRSGAGLARGSRVPGTTRPPFETPRRPVGASPESLCRWLRAPISSTEPLAALRVRLMRGSCARVERAGHRAILSLSTSLEQSMKCMKVSIVAASFILCVASTVFAQNSVAGAWNITVDTPQGPNTSTLNLKQDGDKLTGDLTSAMGSTPITGTFSAGAVAVTANIDMQGTSLQLAISGKVDADTMAGEIKLGDFGSFPFKGTRGASAAAPAAPPAPAASATATGASSADATGKWDLVFNIEGVGEFPVQADFKQDGTKITGTFSGPTG